MRKIAILQTSPPFVNQNGLEAIEMLTALGNVDVDVAMFFIDDGVLQLNQFLKPELIGTKSINKMLGALSYYDIDTIYACKESMKIRHIELTDIPKFIQPHENNEFRSILEQYDEIIHF